MIELIAIDPGDKYVGVAFFDTEAENPWLDSSRDEWRCIDAQEHEPNAFLDGFAQMLLDGDVGTVVYEKFRLYADKANEQVGSEFLTSQMIGVICYLVRVNNMHYERHQKTEREGHLLSCEQRGGMCQDGSKIRPVTLVKQRADDKKPTAGILRSKGIKSVAKPISKEHYGGRDHVVDAELHGWFYLLHNSKGREA